MGRHKGITEQQLDALDEFEASTALGELEKLVLRYAVGMTGTPVDVPDELFDALDKNINIKSLGYFFRRFWLGYFKKYLVYN